MNDRRIRCKFQAESMCHSYQALTSLLPFSLHTLLLVFRDGVHTYSLNEGNFASEAGLHAGLLLSGDVESSCAVIAKSGISGQPSKSARLLRWDRSELMRLLNKESGLRRALTVAMSWDIVRKLKGQRSTIQMVDDPELWTQKRKEQSEERYTAIIQNVLQCPDFFEKRRVELNKYRIIHHIDDQHHKLALEKCGWTLEEYEAGECKQDLTKDYGRYPIDSKYMSNLEA